MRIITELCIDAFLNAKNFKMANTEIIVKPNVTVMELHGNPIAYRYNDPARTLSVTTAGWNTPTTKERLNGLENVHVRTKAGKLYLNGKLWDGRLVDVDTWDKH